MNAVYTSELERVEADNKLLRELVRLLERDLADARKMAAACADLVDKLRLEMEGMTPRLSPRDD